MCINICTCTYIHVYTYKQTCHIYPYIYRLPHNYLFVDYTHSRPGEKKALQLGNWNRGAWPSQDQEKKNVFIVWTDLSQATGP